VSKSRRRAQQQTLLVGLAATVAVVVAYLLGGLDWLELKTLDLRFLYANSITESDALVLIDIDDESLDLVGRWPWPRDIQAALIRILHEAGLQRLLYDIELSEPEFARSLQPAHADILTSPEQLGLAAEDLPTAYPDHELRLAIADAAPVYLAFHYLGTARDGQPPNPLPYRGGLKPSPSDTTDPPVVPPERGDGADAPLGKGDGLARADTKAEPLVVRVERWFEEHPDAWQAPLPTQFERVFNEVAGADPRLYEEAAHALRGLVSAVATTKTCLVLPPRFAAAAPAVPAIAPVYFPHARAAARCGFAVFEPDADGIMRRTPLLVRYEDAVLPQLAFAVAFDELGPNAEGVELRPGQLLLRAAGRERPLAIQLDERDRALVPWVARRRWNEQFGPHVPMGAVWQVYDRRLKVRQNQELIRDTLATLLEHEDCEPWRTYHDDLRRRLELDGELQLARYRDDAETARQISDWIAQYDKLLSGGEPAIRAMLAPDCRHSGRASVRRYSLLAREHGPDTAPNSIPSADRVADAGLGGPALQGSASVSPAGQMSAGVSPATQSNTAVSPAANLMDTLRRAFAANDAHQREIDELRTRLRQRVAGRIGLVGYTATALADMAPIPTSKRAPGIIAHANLLNGLLTGRTVSWAPTWLNGLLSACLGLLATALSARWRPRAAAMLLALIAVVYVGLAGAVAFYVWTHWIALVPVLIAMGSSFVAVLLFRYVFLERESRQIATALRQYTSVALARQMADNAELCRRAEVREVTAMFTDLAGFTSLSERIGATRTQRLLNLVLGRISNVIMQHEGMINKFIGDGVFAFWNPVIYPQPDHARRACAAALDIQAALRSLIDEQRRAGGDEAFSHLRLRIGVATGNAVVGPCGSEQKYDYTCIGDSVNVAARLESANKFYGTRILISGATRDQAGDDFVVRYLGIVQVKGKTQGVAIFELLGRAEHVDDRLACYARAFAAAVEAFQQRQWRQALALFQARVAECPDDLAAQRYLMATRTFLSSPPPDNWSGALELTEK